MRTSALFGAKNSLSIPKPYVFGLLIIVIIVLKDSVLSIAKLRFQ